jgi:hypothetical protein
MSPVVRWVLFELSQFVAAPEILCLVNQKKECDMTMSSSGTKKIIGIVLIVLGAGLALWGFQLSGSVGSQVTQAVTGSDTDKVMTLYIAGAVSFVVGLYLFVKN